MSRIIVKNLPIYLTEDRLRTHFAKQGTVTDAKLVKGHSGQSRRFGFVGFKTEQEAEAAVKYFHESFIDTAKLHVEIVHERKDRKRPNADGEERGNKRQKSRVEEPKEVDAKLKEFMEVVGKRSNAKTWANDDAIGAPEAVAVEKEPVVSAPLADEKDSDDEYDEGVAKIVEEDEEEDEGEEGPGLDLLAQDSGVSDMDWLKQHSVRKIEDEVDEEGNVKKPKKTKQVVESERVDEFIQPAQESEHEKQSNEIMQSKRLFLRNLAYSSTEQEFRDLFSTYGTLEEVHISIDPKKNKSKGFAYVSFQDGEDAVRAFEALDGTVFQGRLLHILPGKPKRENKLDEFDLKNLPLKKQQELKKRANAAKQQFSWNSLYMNTDAVVSSVASQLGISKAELLDPTSSDSAVKQALAEATVLNNVRDYFESKRVDLLSFNKKERSDNVILVKNFPYDTKADEISDLFGQYGDVTKLLMPPDGGIAIVVLRTIPQGRAAFAKLAFRRFRSSILYLEKGPKDLFEDGSALPVEEGDNVIVDETQKAKEAKASAADILAAKDDADTNDDIIDRTSLFVKNLNFKTTHLELTNAFKALNGFLIAQVKMKADKKDATKKLSEGYGFVEFKTKHDAQVAMAAMEGHVLDGHKLQVKLSSRGESDKAAVPKGGKGQTKIIVKNVPFEANKDDIRNLFGTFGQLRTVRVPKKFNKSARGFAFAEFVTAKEAENAMKALQGTHLLGRRLVIQWAEQDAENAEEEIERMEKKVAKQVQAESYAAMRLSGKRRAELDEQLGDGDDMKM